MNASDPYWFGLYGAVLREPQVDVGDFRVFRNPNLQPTWTRDQKLYWLTAVGYLPRDVSTQPHHLLADLAAAWTVVQQQDVKWVGPLEPLPESTPVEEVVDGFVESQDLQRKRQRRGFGSPVAAEQFHAATESVWTKLQTGDPDFRASCYRAAESLRLATTFVDMTYYLIFSGLELLARTRTGVLTGDVSLPIHTFLTDPKFGAPFDMVKDPENPLYRSVQSYCHVRNALFHNGQLSVTKRADGGRRTATYELKHYLLMLEGLLPLVLIRDSGLTLDETQRDTWTLPSSHNAPSGGWGSVLK